MTLDEFISERRKELAIFQENWEACNKNHDEMFPLEMNQGDWDEQYKFMIKERSLGDKIECNCHQ